MKKLVVTFFFLLIFTFSSYSQQTAPPPPGEGASGTPGTGDITSQNGGGAPIGGGLFILLGLGVAYGGKKLYDARKTPLEE